MKRSESERGAPPRVRVELPYSAARLWALFQRYDLWKEYAPAVIDVEIVCAGDAHGDGRRGEAYELVSNVRPNEGYDYVMLRTGLSG